MPERHQEQQSQKKKQRPGDSVVSPERLVVHHLAGETCVVFRCGNVLMEQTNTMEANKAQQHHLDNPSAQDLFPIAPLLGHALSSPPIKVYLSGQNPPHRK
jgi:hypothetical protein